MIPEKKIRQKFYRIINLFYAIYALIFGFKHRDNGLVMSSILLFVTDAVLIYKDVYNTKILQTIRMLAFLVLGPFWIKKGKQYNNKLLTLFGLTFIIFDGGLFLIDFLQSMK